MEMLEVVTLEWCFESVAMLAWLGHLILAHGPDELFHPVIVPSQGVVNNS